MWKVIRTCIPKKSTEKKCFSSDDESVANNFNQFFTSVGSNTVTKIKSLAKENNYTPSQLPFIPRSYPESEQFTFEPVECTLVEYIVKSMPDNKSPGIDKIPIRVIKDCLPVISPWITSIINNSLVNNIFPSTWKIAEVIPIPKQGDHELANNNRPQSINHFIFHTILHYIHQIIIMVPFYSHLILIYFYIFLLNYISILMCRRLSSEKARRNLNKH